MPYCLSDHFFPFADKRSNKLTGLAPNRRSDINAPWIGCQLCGKASYMKTTGGSVAFVTAVFDVSGHKNTQE